MATPFIVANRNENVLKGLDEPVPPLTTASGGGIYLVDPIIVEYHRTGNARSVNEPMAGVTAQGRKNGLVQPFLAQ